LTDSLGLKNEIQNVLITLLVECYLNPIAAK